MRTVSGRVLLAFGITILTIVGLARADTIHVNGVCGDNAWTGATPVCKAPDGPKRTIQAAINATSEGDVVLIADGVYTGPENKNLDFGGKAITVRSADGPDGCVIDCQGDGRGFDFHSNESHDSILQGLTITNGDVEGEIGYSGGGIRLRGSSPTISNCIITGNRAYTGGGGINCSGSSSPLIMQCLIRRNYSIYRGGGIHCNGPDNDATIINCTITRNGTDHYGGGISCTGNNTTITNCVISVNSAQRGSGVHLNGGRPAISSSTIIDNTAGSGGGVWLSSGTVVNCIITGNSASNGGGVYALRDAGPLTNCTIVGNAAADLGGGVYVDSHASVFFVTNCVLRNDTAALGSEIAALGQTAVSHCDIEGGRAATHGDVIWEDGNIDADPAFAFADDFHLMPGSPCVDAGTNDPPGGLPASGYDGNIRPLDGDGNMEAVADIGAYEFNPALASIAVSTASFEFFAAEGGPNPHDQVLNIRNSGAERLNWEIAAQCAWLTADPPNGESTGEVDDVALRVDVSQLTHGVHSCILTVSDSDAANSPRKLRVMLHVNRALRVPSTYGTIQAAIDAAVDGDVVLISDGTYAGPGNKNLMFRGKAITVRSANGPENCTIDCEGDGRGVDFHSGDTRRSILDGLTLTNGYVVTGGGIRCEGTARPTIMNCTITSNSTAGENGRSGGGVYCGDVSQPRLINCTITNNTAARDGGGISSSGSGSMPIITDCLISGNIAVDRYGGGVSIAPGGSAIIRGCRILSNEADDRGGGISAADSDDPVITDCIIAGNRSGSGGGVAFFGSHGSPTLIRCDIARNSALGSGGGVFCFGSLGTELINCTITDNSANLGGALLCSIASPRLTGCTISRNFAAGLGGGVYVQGDGRPEFTNCILWRDTPQEFYVSSGTPVIRYCDVQGGWPGDGNIAAPPLFVAPSDGDYHLSPDSPCIDAGDPNFILEPGETDLDGQVRVWNGRVDMGADEFGSFVLGDINCDGVIDVFDIEPFLLALFDPHGYAASYPDCDINLADLNVDGSIDAFDIAPFLAVLFGT